VVFEINGIRKGYEGVYMEEVKHDLKGRMSKHENRCKHSHTKASKPNS